MIRALTATGGVRIPIASVVAGQPGAFYDAAIRDTFAVSAFYRMAYATWAVGSPQARFSDTAGGELGIRHNTTVALVVQNWATRLGTFTPAANPGLGWGIDEWFNATIAGDITRNGSDAVAGDLDLFIDGSELTGTHSGTTTSTQHGTDGHYFLRLNSSAFEGAVGEVAEILVCRREMDATERLLVSGGVTPLAVSSLQEAIVYYASLRSGLVPEIDLYGLGNLVPVGTVSVDYEEDYTEHPPVTMEISRAYDLVASHPSGVVPGRPGNIALPLRYTL